MTEAVRCGQALGVIAQWDLHPRNQEGDLVLMPVERLRAMLDARELPESMVGLPDVRLGQAIKRTLAGMVRDGLLELEERQEERVDQTGNRKNDDRAVYVLKLKRTDDEGEDVAWRTATKVIHYKNEKDPEKALRFVGPLVESELRPLIELYQRSYTTEDIAAQILRPTVLNRCYGFALRRHGGSYFVGAEYVPILDRLAAFMADVADEAHCVSFMTALPVLDGDTTRASMGLHAFNALPADIRDVETDLREMQRDDRRDKVRPATAEKYEAKLVELARKATALTKYSEMATDNLGEALAGLYREFAAWATPEAAAADHEREAREAEALAVVVPEEITRLMGAEGRGARAGALDAAPQVEAPSI
jgi:hypothetical protein